MLEIKAIRIKQLKKIHSGGPFAIMSVYKSDKEKPEEERQYTISVNKKRHEGFLKELNDKGYKYEAAGGGWYNDRVRQFIPEKSLLIKGIPFNEAIALGKKYQQEAIVHKEENGPVTLYDLAHGTATPTENVEIVAEMPGTKKEPGPSPKPKLFDPNEPPKTKFRNVELKYEFHPEKEYFKLSDGPITWDKVKSYIERTGVGDEHSGNSELQSQEQKEADYQPRISKRAHDLFRRW